MRVLQVSSHYPPLHTGGAERCCNGLAHALAEHGHEVTVAAPVPEARNGPVRVRSLPATGPRTLQKLFYDYTSPAATAVLRDVISDFKPDVVHFHNVYGIGSRLIRMAAALRPTVVTLHDYWPMDVFSPSYRGGVPKYPRRAALLRPLVQLHRRLHGHHLSQAQLVAPSRFLAERVGAALGRDIAVVPNGFNTPDTPTQSEPAILFVGRLVQEKGLDTVLQAAVGLAEAAGWRIDIVGDGPLREELATRFRTVRFHGNAEAAPFYERSAILMVPSIWPENAPYVVLEGMGHGLAVLAAAAGGIPEMICDGETGLLYVPGDTASFRAAMQRLVQDAALRTAIGRAARKQVAAHTWSLVVERYLQVYAAAQHVGEHRRAASPEMAEPREKGIHV